MTFAEIVPALKAGKRCRRAAWPEGRWTERKGAAPLSVWMPIGMTWKCACAVDFADLLADDWELVPEEPRATDWELAHEVMRVEVERLTRELAAEREARQFSHAGNATLSEAGAKMALELGQLRRELEQAKRDIAGRDTLNEILRKELASAKDYALDFKTTVERLTGERTRLERDLRELRAGISADRATLLRDLEDTRRVRDQRWEDAKQAKKDLRVVEAQLVEERAKALRFEQRLGLVTGRIRELAEDWCQK